MTKQQHLIIARSLAKLLDSRFQIFGIKFGLDPIFDIIPGLGSIVATIISLYLLFVAKQLHLPSKLIFKMIINIILDFFIGLVPFAGPIGTIFFRSNIKNIKIIDDYLKTDVIEEGQILG